MKKASFKLKAVSSEVYHAISLFNRQFDDLVESLDLLMTFGLVSQPKLHAYQAMLHELRALLNQELHEVLGEREMDNSVYYEHQRLKIQSGLASISLKLPKQSAKPARRNAQGKKAKP